MDNKEMTQILDQVASGKMSAEQAAEEIRKGEAVMPFADLDLDRKERTGAPETIYCPGKTSKQIAEIAVKLSETSENIMATRATPENYEVVKKLMPDSEYYDDARIILVRKNIEPDTDGRVAVITAGTAEIGRAHV